MRNRDPHFNPTTSNTRKPNTTANAIIKFKIIIHSF